MADHHDYGWVGSVAGGVGMAIGAAVSVFVGAWKLIGPKKNHEDGNIMAEINSLKAAVANLQDYQRHAEEREVRAEGVRAEIFDKLNGAREDLAEIKGALGLPRR